MKTTLTKILLAVLGCVVLASSTGCGKSDAARMEEFRKYARKSSKDEEEESSTPAPSPAAPPAALPTRGTPAGRGGPPKATASASPAPSTAAPSTTSTPASPAATSAAGSPQLNGKLSDTKAPPSTPLSETERRQMSIDNLTTIAQALEKFRDSKGGASYPPQYSTDASKQPLLSWRVHLLPLLGYGDLYQQFRLNERWDSAHNMQLIEQIPSVYQSPERFDVYTNYVVPASGSTAFDGAKVRGIRRWEDGLLNSIILVEVNDDQSVIWTQPQDLDFDPQRPREGLSGLRNDGFFAIWGGGQLSVVPPGSGNLKAAFTVDGGDQIAATMKKPAIAQSGGIASRFQKNGGSSSSASAGGDSPAATTDAGSAPVSVNSTVSTSAAAAAVMSLNADAQTAFTEGREAEAIQMYYAAITADQEAESWAFQYRWIPGLSRPVAIMRYGVGIIVSGPGAAAARRTALQALASRQNTGFAPGSGSERAYGKLTGRFGGQILAAVTAQPIYAPFIVEEQKPVGRRLRRDDDDSFRNQIKRHQARLAPGVQFIGVDSERTLMSAARKHEVDALVLVRIEDRNSSRDVQIEVVDIVRKKVIFASEKLNSKKVQAARIDLVKDDPTPRVVKSFQDFLRTKLQHQPIPPQLRPEVAAKRVRWLAANHDDDRNPLRMLAEIKLYKQLGLIGLNEQMEAYKRVLTPDAALTLIGGTSAEKAAILDPFLPVRTLPAS